MRDQRRRPRDTANAAQAGDPMPRSLLRPCAARHRPARGSLTASAAVVLALWAPTAPSPAAGQGLDVTPRVERIGNPARLSYPAEDKTFARNAWDLKAFAGRLYVGLGNRDNSEPAPNAGPVDVWFFSPDSGQFVKEGTLPDEQIETFRVLDGKLVIPGNDPMEPWELGNFYRLDAGSWTKIRTLPNGIHNFDMINGDAIY